MMHRRYGAAGARGMVLIVVLVLLGVLTVIVAAVASTSNINFRIAGNQQYRMEAHLAAQNAVEEYLSNPANFRIPLPVASSSIGIDLDGDNNNEFTAVVPPPTCLRSLPIKFSELDIADSGDQPCFGSGSAQNSGVLGNIVSAGNSSCSKMIWDVRANVTDVPTNTNLTLHQGVYLRALIGTPCP